MAGAGYKLFATGDVLTAAQVNTYLQQQVIMVFADSTARTTALSGVLAEGMFSYLTGTNAFQYYDGAAWADVSNPGDITGVTAGTGLSGGGSSGAVSLAIDTATTVDKTTAQTLTNKTLTTPIISSISNTGTLTLPTSTDTLVGRATTDTLTNKTLTTPIISSISNTGTLTLPTSTDTLVGRATTDTLTNKTLTTPVIASISNSGTITVPTGTDTLVGRATTDTLTNKTLTASAVNNPIIKSPEERCTVSATAATGTIAFDTQTQGVLYYTTNASGNFTLNFTNVNANLAVGDSISCVFLNTNGGTAYYASAFQVDSSAVTPKWSGGTAPTAGNASAIDAYSFTIIKTAATPTYTVLAGGATKFA
jgi:hypothetical protein